MPSELIQITKRLSIDHSIASEHDGCPRKAHYRYNLNREAFGRDTSSTSFGTAIHKFDEIIHQSNGDYEKATTEALKGFENPPIDHPKSYLDKGRLGRSFATIYSKFQNEQRVGGRTTIITEKSFLFPLPSGRYYGGRFDRIFEWNGRLWVRDRKTTSWWFKNNQARYDMNHQMTGYVWGAGKLAGRPIAGVIVEKLYNTKENGPENKVIMTTRTEADIEAFVEWAEAKWDEWELCESKNRWPMKTSHCFAFNRQCEFYDACMKGNDWDAINNWLENNTYHKHWDFTKEDVDE